MKVPVYLDYMASTPIDPQVFAIMCECLGPDGYFANPSSRSHSLGFAAADIIENARQQVADLLHAHPREIIWTSGATEADNLAIKGAATFYQRKGKHIITMATEHKAVLNSCAYLETQGYTVTYLKPKTDGLLDLEELQSAIRPDTILVSIMWVNNETGVVQDIEQIAAIVKKYGIIFHVDAVQAVGKIAIDLQKIPIDLLSVTAHKVYGPKGIGALYIRRTPRIRITPQIHGGKQEHDLRSGTLPTHQIAGMGKAFALANERLTQENAHIQNLANQFWQELASLEGVLLNGHQTQRVPHCFNLIFAGVDSESLLLSLTSDCAIANGSACHSTYKTPSHVLTAMGIRHDQANAAVRISLGRFTTIEEIRYAAVRIKENVQQLR